nr:MAG TPA: hypothetical protein [Caudoviricetes sp.]
MAKSKYYMQQYRARKKAEKLSAVAVAAEPTKEDVLETALMYTVDQVKETYRYQAAMVNPNGEKIVNQETLDVMKRFTSVRKNVRETLESSYLRHLDEIGKYYDESFDLLITDVDALYNRFFSSPELFNR